MSGFTESAFERKLAELNPSQQSIQTLSMWLIHHRKHYNSIVKLWYKEFLKAQEHRKLTFIYLANDVIQNSRKKGGEFGKAYAPIFKKALEYMARIPHEKTKKSILRILAIWEERHIYETPLIKDFQKSYKKVWSDLHDGEFDVTDAIGNSVTTPPYRSPSKDSSSKESEYKIEDSIESGSSRSSKSVEQTSSGSTENKSKRKGEHGDKSGSKDKHGQKRHSHSGGSGTGESSSGSTKRIRTKKEEIDSALRKRSMEATNTIDEWEVDGVTQIEVKLSPSPFKDPPTEEELIQMTKDLDKMPSTDAVTRGKIANVPPEVSDAMGVDEICIDSDVSRVLQKKIQQAADLLQDYNKKLDIELDDRKNASMKLQDFIHHQKDLLTQAEHRLEEHQNHSKILSRKLEELKAHVQSMPDFTKLPSVTDGLAPLPSAGDLFNLW